MDRQRRKGLADILKLTIEHGAGEMANIFVRAFEVAMQIERERFLGAHLERARRRAPGLPSTPANRGGPETQPTGLSVCLFHENTYEAFDARARPVRFGRKCSADRIRNTLSIYSARDFEYMTNKEGIVTADCQF